MAANNGVGVAIPQPQPSGGGSPLSGVSRLPMPVLAIGAGALLGGIVFVANRMRRSQVSSAQGTPQLLPSVPIMLGSLQQSLLDLQGQVGSGMGGLTSAVSNEQTALSQNISDATTSINQNITNTSGAISAQIADATATYKDALQSKSDLLSNEIANLGTQILNVGSGQDALSQQLKDAQAALTGELGSVQDNLKSISAGQGTITTDLNSLTNATSALGTQVTGLAGEISNMPGPWSAYNGRIVAFGQNGKRNDPNNTWTYYVQNGNLFGIANGSAFQRLSGLTPDQYANGGIVDGLITMVSTPDATLRQQMTGTITA